jgi:hypothetical protein
MALRDKINEALDDEIDLDFSSARDSDFSPVECRQYEFEVVSAKPGTSGSGNPKVVFELRIVDDSPAKGRLFFKHCPTRGEGSGILREMLRALGIDPEAPKLKPADTVGKHILGTVRFQKDSDEYQEVVKPKAVAGKSSGARRTKLS